MIETWKGGRLRPGKVVSDPFWGVVSEPPAPGNFADFVRETWRYLKVMLRQRLKYVRGT